MLSYEAREGAREGRREGGHTEPQAFAHAGSDGNDIFDCPTHLNL